MLLSLAAPGKQGLADMDIDVYPYPFWLKLMSSTLLPLGAASLLECDIQFFPVLPSLAVYSCCWNTGWTRGAPLVRSLLAAARWEANGGGAEHVLHTADRMCDFVGGANHRISFSRRRRVHPQSL